MVKNTGYAKVKKHNATLATNNKTAIVTLSGRDFTQSRYHIGRMNCSLELCSENVADAHAEARHHRAAVERVIRA